MLLTADVDNLDENPATLGKDRLVRVELSSPFNHDARRNGLRIGMTSWSLEDN